MYELEQDLSWYVRRATARSGVNPEVVSRVLDVRVRLMAPFTPFISETIWSLMGKKGFVSRAEWPQPDTTLMDERAEEVESLVRTTVEDVASILKTTGMSVKKLFKPPHRICRRKDTDWEGSTSEKPSEMPQDS
jgi:leucyl-tRNA synthetase